QSQGMVVTGKFSGDDQGWFHADLVVSDRQALLPLERYLASEEGIRAELNTWAAWLETIENNAHSGRLMQHMITTRQVFTLEQPADQHEDIDRLCSSLCRFLARATDGVYQVDGQGFYDASGTLLVRES